MSKIKNSKKFVLIFSVFIFYFSFFIFHFSFAQDAAKEEADLAIAQKAYDDGFYEISLGLIERFIKDYPQSPLIPKANLLVGQSLFQKERFLKAKEAFEGLLDFVGADAVKDEVFYWLAEVYFKARDYQEARTYYRRLIEEFPRSRYAAFAQYSLGWSYFEEEKFPEAKDAFLNFKQKFPEDKLAEDAGFKAAICFYNLKDFKNAKEEFFDFIKRYPKSKLLTEVFFYRAECEYYLENFSAAQDDYLKVINSQSDRKLIDLAQAGLGWVYLKLKKYDEARAAFDNLEGDVDIKTSAAVLLGRAEVAKEKQDFKNALQLYDEFIAAFSKDENIYAAYFGKAEVLSALLKYEEAIAGYRDILTADKDAVRRLMDKIYYNLGWLYLKTGNFKQAIFEFRLAADITEDKAIKNNALCQIADINQDLGEFSRSLEIYDGILEGSADHRKESYILYKRSLSLIKLSRFDEAISSLKNIINFSDSSLKAEAQYYIGAAYFQRQDFNYAVEELDKFILLFKESLLRPEGMYLKAIALSNLGRFKEAQDVLKEAEKEYGQDLNFVAKCEFEIARILYANKEIDTAVKKMQEILSRYPNVPPAADALYFLGSHFLNIGKEEVAARYFKRLSVEYPQSSLGEDSAIKAVFALGNKYLKEENFDAALAQYQEVLAKGIDFSKEAYLKIADIYKHKGEALEAVKIYKQARDKAGRGDAAEIQFKIAETLEEAADVKGATEEYRKIIYFYPEAKKWLLKSYLRLAKIFEDKGDWVEAEKVYSKIADMDEEEAKFALERLEAISKILK